LSGNRSLHELHRSDLIVVDGRGLFTLPFFCIAAAASASYSRPGLLCLLRERPSAIGFIIGATDEIVKKQFLCKKRHPELLCAAIMVILIKHIETVLQES